MTISSIIGYSLVALISSAFFISWILSSQKWTWTFFLALIVYVPTMFSLYVKEWKVFGVLAFIFIGVLHIYFYDLYISSYKATRGGRR